MKKLSNKILIIILVVLVGIFIASKIFRSPGLESNMRKELVKLDTSKVTEIRIQPTKEGASEVRLMRANNKWLVAGEGKESDAGAGMVQSMLGVMMNLEAQRMVTRNEDRWETFQVGEKATHVSVYENSKKVADFRIGKAGFNQGQQGMGGMGGAGSAYTYIRLSDEDEVYTSDGFIATHFNRTFNEWRNQLFLKIDKNNVSKLVFTYPDSSFVLEKRGSLWYLDNTSITETKINQYFGRIRLRNVPDFEDQFTVPGVAPLKLEVVGPEDQLATAQAWPKNENEFVLTSTFQEGVYFNGKRSGVIKDIFVGRSWFVEQ